MNRKSNLWLWGIVSLMLPLFFGACGSEDDDECDIELPAPFTSPNGETVSLSQIMDGDSIPCAGFNTGGQCTVTVNFTVTGLSASTTARLLVELTKTDDGDDFCDDPFPQGTGTVVTPAQGGGQLTGVLGPPVNGRVRFNVAVELLNAQGQRIAVSPSVQNLRPTA